MQWVNTGFNKNTTIIILLHYKYQWYSHSNCVRHGYEINDTLSDRVVISYTVYVLYMYIIKHC